MSKIYDFKTELERMHLATLDEIDSCGSLPIGFKRRQKLKGLVTKQKQIRNTINRIRLKAGEHLSLLEWFRNKK